MRFKPQTSSFFLACSAFFCSQPPVLTRRRLLGGRTNRSPIRQQFLWVLAIFRGHSRCPAPIGDLHCTARQSVKWRAAGLSIKQRPLPIHGNRRMSNKECPRRKERQDQTVRDEVQTADFFLPCSAFFCSQPPVLTRRRLLGGRTNRSPIRQQFLWVLAIFRGHSHCPAPIGDLHCTARQSVKWRAAGLSIKQRLLPIQNRRMSNKECPRRKERQDQSVRDEVQTADFFLLPCLFSILLFTASRAHPSQITRWKNEPQPNSTTVFVGSCDFSWPFSPPRPNR